MNGIINLKKEAGMTSHDAVFKLRKILGTKKIGHGGTLDPDVVGVLPIAVGKATRMVEFMQDEGKIYEGEITLGYSTKTEDASGEVVAETPVLSLLDEKLVDEAIASLTGPITQIPPMYSAVKVNGRKLYEYARAGQEVERPERQVTIYQFERTSPISYDGQLARTPEEATEVRFGRFIELDQTDKELAAFEDDKLLAILEKRGNLYKPRKVFS